VLSRTFACLLLCAYFFAGLVLIGLSAAFGIVFSLAVPLACILWPETLADSVRGLRTVPLPPEMVFGLGWFVFLLPAILGGVLWLML
jgi:hypothetical protein